MRLRFRRNVAGLILISKYVNYLDKPLNLKDILYINAGKSFSLNVASMVLVHHCTGIQNDKETYTLLRSGSNNTIYGKKK